MAGVFDLELSEGHGTGEEFEIGDDAIEVDQVRAVSTCMHEHGTDVRPNPSRWT